MHEYLIRRVAIKKYRVSKLISSVYEQVAGYSTREKVLGYAETLNDAKELLKDIKAAVRDSNTGEYSGKIVHREVI